MPVAPTLAPLFSSASNEWYTPSVYIQAARAVMGHIDLDPASCEEANRIVGATRYYTRDEDGLALPLYGCVWCNPPYGTTRGKSNADRWTRHVARAYRAGALEQAILLINANTDTAYFQALLVPYLVCLTLGRINFRQPGGVHKYRNTHGSAFIYLGPHLERFYQYFSPFGTIVVRYTPPAPPAILQRMGELA